MGISSDPDATAMDFGRFSDPALQILVSLTECSKHGWAISNDIEERTGRRPQPATLYGALSRLEERGLVRPGEPEGRRRPYLITDSGLRALDARLAVLERLVAVGRQALRSRSA